MNIFLQGAVLTAAMMVLTFMAITFLTDPDADEAGIPDWWIWPGLMLAALLIAAALVRRVLRVRISEGAERDDTNRT